MELRHKAREPDRFRKKALCLIESGRMPAKRTPMPEDRRMELDCALFSAAENGKNSDVKRLIKAGADIAAIRKYKSWTATALHVAAFNGHAKTCLLIIGECAKSGKDIMRIMGAKDNYGAMALHHAAFNRHTKACALLIGEYVKAGGGADGYINAKDNGGETPLQIAARMENAKTVRFLAEAGARALVGMENGRRFVSLFRGCTA
jgi:ankyrin repeat protein